MKSTRRFVAALAALPLLLAFAAGVACAADVETPTMGWSSWNAFRVNISEGTIMHHADLVKELNLPEGFSPCCGMIVGKTTETYTAREIPEGRIATAYIK